MSFSIERTVLFVNMLPEANKMFSKSINISLFKFKFIGVTLVIRLCMFQVGKTWKQPKGPSMGDWIKKYGKYMQ